MAYLLPAEYARYGLSTETADAWVVAASAMIDAHCRRLSLLATIYTERLRVGRAGTAQLSYGPIVSVHGAKAKYARLAGRADGAVPFEELIAGAFGLAGSWIDLDPAMLQVSVATGEVSFATNVLGARFAETEITYEAGFSVAPEAVKVACAQIVKNAQAIPGLNVKSTRVDTLQTQYFSDSLLDSQVRELLRPYMAERLS